MDVPAALNREGAFIVGLIGKVQERKMAGGMSRGKDGDKWGKLTEI